MRRLFVCFILLLSVVLIAALSNSAVAGSFPSMTTTSVPCVAGTATWGTNCSASVPILHYGDQTTVTNTASGYTGSVTVTCGGGYNYSNMSCTAVVIALSPSSLPGGTYNTPYSQTISASGGTSPYTYAVTTGSLPSGLSLNSSTGAITGTPLTSGTFSFTITATDANNNSGAQAYSLVIGAPTIALSPTSISPVYGSAYSQTITASGGISAYTYAVTSGSLPGGLSLNGSTGAITGTPNATGAYSFTITATDAHSQTGSQAYSGTVANPTIALSPTTLTAGTYNTAYSQAITASGGIASYTYAVTTGSLPSGVTLSSGGVLSGTPTTSGSFNFTITATEANSHTGSQAYSWTINAPTIALSPTSLTAGTYNTAYSQTITASGGVASYTFAVTSGSLPSGLSLSSGGTLSGTPTTSGSYSFTITATDAHS
jgi:hypothetical protein